MNGTISKKTKLSKRGKKPSTYRRIVTGNVNGKSVVQSDERMQAYEFETVPNYKHTLVWINPTTPDLRRSKGLALSRLLRSGTWRHQSSLCDLSAEFGFCGPAL